MIDTTEAFFARLAQRGYEPLLHNVSGTIRWDIGDVGSWFVTVKNGSLTVSRWDCLRGIRVFFHAGF